MTPTNTPNGSASAQPRVPRFSRATSVLFTLIVALVAVYTLLWVAAGDGAVEPSKADFRVISAQGEPVDIVKHLAPGKFTVIDFYAEWCAPCVELEPYLQNLATTHDRFAVRKVNVVHWDTPVAAQYGLEDYGLPYLKMYGPDGTMIAEGFEPVLDEIRARF